MVGAGGGGGGGGGRDGGTGISGAGTAGFRDGERDLPFWRLGRAVSPASCAATELELEPPMAIAPAAGGGVVEDCCWISRVLPQFCRRDSVTNFGGWSLDLPHCLACAVPHFPMSYRDSADSSPGHCAAGHYCFVPRAIAVLMRDRYQTTVAQTAADWLGVHDSGCGPQLLMEPAG